ncbi:phage tail tape measure protein [Lacrimispora sp. JR3]|uniref:phage tail tape measure protein n=1 Tax=Lacrimispora sinapis TaxID=3111456 RepID=UPI0037494E93
MEYSLQIYDGASKALSVINNSIQSAAKSLENFQRKASRSLSLSSFAGIEKSLSIIDGEYREVADNISDADKKQKKLNKSTEEQEQKIGKVKKAWQKVMSSMDKIGLAKSPMDMIAQANNVKIAGNSIQAKTGLKGENLDMAKQSAQNLYQDNMSKSPQEAAQSLSSVYQMTGKTGEGLEQVTRAGLLLQDTFGYGLTDSIKSAGMLQQQFGLEGAEAFDLIIQATQSGLNKNGDLLQTINDSSEGFQNLGLGGQEMFNMLINGAQNGNVSVGTLGDAVSEFSAKAVSGGQDASEGFSALGLDAGKMTEAFGSGGETAKQAFLETVNALNNMDDSVSRNIAGTKLFGSSWGELGQQGISALSNLNGSVEISSQNLNELNQLKFSDATSALTTLANTINMGLAGPMTGVVQVITSTLNDFTTGLQGNVENINGIFGMLGYGIGLVEGFVSDNWSIIGPVIYGIIAALNAKKACELAGAAATSILEIAQKALNKAFWTSPIGLIIITIIALIAVFYAAVAIVNKFAGTSYSATGLICGAFSIVVAFIQNSIMAMCELVFAVIEFIVNKGVAFANFFANLFNDPVGSIIHLFVDMADSVLGVIQKIAKGLDIIFGKNMEASVKVWKEDLASFGDKFAKDHGNGKYEKKFNPLDMDEFASQFGFSVERKNLTEAGKSGYEKGSDKNLFGGGFDNMKGILGGKNNPFDPSNFGGDSNNENQPDLSSIEKNLNLNSQNNSLGASGIPNSISQNTGATAMNTAAMTNTMDVMDEDLKYMRDAAEQEIINRFTLAELKLDVNNNNTIKNVADADNVLRMLSDTTAEVLCSFAEGVNA